MKEFVKKDEKLKPGRYVFKIVGVGEKVPTTKSFYRPWIFESESGQELKQYLFPWMYYPILEALGCQSKTDEEGNAGIEWDPVFVEGESMEAELYMEPDRNDPNKSWPRLKEFKATPKQESIPF